MLAEINIIHGTLLSHTFRKASELLTTDAHFCVLLPINRPPAERALIR
jgi:hypothetical protein